MTSSCRSSTGRHPTCSSPWEARRRASSATTRLRSSSSTPCRATTPRSRRRDTNGVSVVSIGSKSPAGGSLDPSEPPGTRFAPPARERIEAPPGEPRRIGYLYILPAFAFFGVFVLFPMGHSLWLSFTNWDGLTPAKWIGLGNYRGLVSDPEVRAAFGHALVLVVFYSFIPVTIGLLLAASLSRMRVRGMTFFRTVLFLPQVIAMVVVGVIWRWMYTPLGSVNALLRAVGLGLLQKVWLGDFRLTL